MNENANRFGPATPEPRIRSVLQLGSPGLTPRQVADYWAVHRYTGPKHGDYQHQEGFSDALVGMITGDANSLVVFRQLMDAARSADERAELLTGYLRDLRWKDDPGFAFWLRSIETSSTADAETFALIRRHSENAEQQKPGDLAGMSVRSP